MKVTTVTSVMTSPVVTLDASATLHEAADTLAAAGISGAPVVESGRLVGIISESDIIRSARGPAEVDHGPKPSDLISLLLRGRISSRDLARTVREAMTTHVITLSPHDSVWKAADLMEKRGVKRLPVVEDDILLGIVSRGDLVRYLGRSDAEIEQDVREAVTRLGAEQIFMFDVRCDDAVITLFGVADRFTTRKLAIHIASSVPGVAGVKDRMDHEWDDSETARTKRVSPWNEIRKI